MPCEHREFSATVNVVRLTDKEGGPATGYMAEVRIVCSQCGTPFQFLGLESGCDTQGARVSLDGLEANIAITPEGNTPNPMQRIAYSINRFDG